MLLINENVFVFVYIVEHRRELIKNPIGQKYFKLMSKRKEEKKVYKKVAFYSIFTLLVTSCTLTSTAPSEQGPKQAFGTVTGMVLGGKIANDLTEDSSKNNLWTLAGVTLGAFLGNEIGASMDKTDILMAQNARSFALENNKINSKAAWKNPDSGNSGVIYPTRTYTSGDQPCREFTQEINIGGTIQTGYGKACRMADGSWDIQ